MEIKVKNYMAMQPGYPKVADTDSYYLMLATRLAMLWDNSSLLRQVPDHVREKVVLAAVGYYQDIIADAGLWRAFVMAHKKLYGKPLPFYDVASDYVEYELNATDLRFIIWYVIEGENEENGWLSPLDKQIDTLAQMFYAALDFEYEQAPTPVDYNMIVGVDPNDDADAHGIYDLSHWLFFDSYLMRPAAKVALGNAREEARKIISEERLHDRQRQRLHDLNDRTMLGNPTGPLAMTLGQWIETIVNGEVPDSVAFNDDEHQHDTSASPHKFYTQFVNATGGDEIAFFKTYDDLEQFLTQGMGWDEEDGGVFPQLRHMHNFVLLSSRRKGLLVAPEVAQFVKHPKNPCYDQAQAKAHAHELITVHGRCPIDLVKYLFKHNLVPDAALPADATRKLLLDNWDFLARLYQQARYTSD